MSPKRGHTGTSLGGRIEGRRRKPLTRAQREARDLAVQQRRVAERDAAREAGRAEGLARGPIDPETLRRSLG